MSASALSPNSRSIYHASSSTNLGWSFALSPGPYWHSFEQLRTSGNGALDSIQSGCVGTLSARGGLFRILRDGDFQRMVGLAAEVHRIKAGVTFIVNAARVVQMHRDEESIRLLVQSVSLLGESPVLPEHAGHDRFEITPEEAANNAEDFDVTSIPRPVL